MHALQEHMALVGLSRLTRARRIITKLGHTRWSQETGTYGDET